MRDEETPAPPIGAPLIATEVDAVPRTAAGYEADVEGPPTEVVREGGTFAAFRYRDYTLFWSGAFVSNTGTWMQTFALSIVVYALRRSESDLGIINGLSSLPVLFLAIPAGVLADHVNRRLLIIWAQAALGVQAVVLGVLYVTGNLNADHAVLSLVIIAGLGLFAGVMSAMTFPSWQSMVPDLVPREVLLNGIALNAAQFQSARLLGPLAAGGVLLLVQRFVAPAAAQAVGMSWIFFINAVSFLFVIAALAVVRTRRATPQRAAGPRTREGAFKTFTAGLSYAREHRNVGMLILSVAMMTMFGMPYMMLLPAIVDKALVPLSVVGHARELVIQNWTSYVMAANGLGAVTGALAVASLPTSIKRETLVRYSLAAMSVFLVAFALSRSLPLTLVVSAFTGAAFLLSSSLLNTSIQSCVPHELRGRVMSLFVTAFMGLMPVSSFIFGPLGSAITPMNAVIVGAVVLAAYAVFLLMRPTLLSPETPCADGQAAG